MTHRFDCRLASLQGLPPPALPAMPGRVFRAPMRPTDADPHLIELEHAAVWQQLAREIERDDALASNLRISKPQAPAMRPAPKPAEVGAR